MALVQLGLIISILLAPVVAQQSPAGKITGSSKPASSSSPAQAPAAANVSVSGSGNFAALDKVVQDAIASGNTPGAVLLVGHNGAFGYRKAFGHLTTAANAEAMTPDNVFDLGALTEVIATTPCVMRLEQLGQI